MLSRVRGVWRSGLFQKAMVLKRRLRLVHEASPFQIVDQGTVDPPFAMPLDVILIGYETCKQFVIRVAAE